MSAAGDDTTRGQLSNAVSVSGHRDGRSGPRLGPHALFWLWFAAGMSGAVSFMGMFSIGLFVLPVALALLIAAVLLTATHLSYWPSVLGFGLAGGVGLMWLGYVLGTAGPDQISCSGSSNGPTTCTSNGVPYDPNSIDWLSAAPWLVLGALVAIASVTAFVVLTRLTRGAARNP